MILLSDSILFLLFAETSLILNASSESPDAAFAVDKDTLMMNLGSLGHKIKSVDDIVSKFWHCIYILYLF